MNQAHLIEELFNNLKDKIEFDEDVVALFQILKKMLKINKEKKYRMLVLYYESL